MKEAYGLPNSRQNSVRMRDWKLWRLARSQLAKEKRELLKSNQAEV
jgi:hypothetical protein